MWMAGKRLPIYRNEHKQMRKNCYQQGRMEDRSIQRRVRQGTAVKVKVKQACIQLLWARPRRSEYRSNRANETHRSTRIFIIGVL